MRPLLGVVTRADRASVQVRLKSGLLVSTTNDLGPVRFDTVQVRYDFTECRVVGIERHDPDAVAKEDIDEPDPEVLEDGEQEEDLSEVLEDLDSGALCQMVDGDWDPEEGVLRVEGESSTEYI